MTAKGNSAPSYEMKELENDIQKWRIDPNNKGIQKKKYATTVSFYSVQSRHKLGDYEEPVNIGYIIKSNLQDSWKKAMKRAIKIVNDTCPGLNIEPYDGHERRITIRQSTSSDTYDAFCQGNVIEWDKTALIALSSDWPMSDREGTALHELLHALGVQHEHQRTDRDKFGVTLNEKNAKGNMTDKEWEENWKCQYEPIKSSIANTTFDPHSIMLYAGSHWDVNGDIMGVYGQNFVGKRRNVLSPLDEVGLNLMWPPCERSGYEPSKSKVNGLLYCGRRGATKGHNYPDNDTTDGRCGPTNGANCAACRVLKNKKIPKKNDEGNRVWQGSSGEFYCGKRMRKHGKGHDGVCGPDNGPSCGSCQRLISPNTTCPGGHGLARFVTQQKGYSCDICKARFPSGTVLYGCRKCDYDLCRQCYGSKR